jgi:quinol monooxygenase YgiN
VIHLASIKSKADVEQFLNAFSSFATKDEEGNKSYIVVADKDRGGDLTIMQYPSGAWTTHGKGADYSDASETAVSAEELTALVWKNRSAINKALKG